MPGWVRLKHLLTPIRDRTRVWVMPSWAKLQHSPASVETSAGLCQVSLKLSARMHKIQGWEQFLWALFPFETLGLPLLTCTSHW